MNRGYIGLGKAQAKGSVKGSHSDPACADGQTSSFFFSLCGLWWGSGMEGELCIISTVPVHCSPPHSRDRTYSDGREPELQAVPQMHQAVNGHAENEWIMDTRQF